MRRSSDRYMTVTTVCVVVSILLSSWNLAKVSAESKSNCRQVQSVKSAIVVVLQQSLATIGKKGSAGYAYYRAHPNELAAAKLQGQQELVTFKPRAC